MHSILGYSASELIHNDPSLASAALIHRVKAIRSIKKRLSESGRGEMTFEESNAMIASCFALTFQSTKLDDGLAEYMTFIRGIAIVGMQMGFRGIKPVFPTLFDDNQNEVLQPYMEDLPLIQRGLADAAAASLQGLRPLCTTHLELEYIQKLEEIVEQLYIDSFEGKLNNLYVILTKTAVLTMVFVQLTKLAQSSMVGGCFCRTTYSRSCLIWITR